MYDVIRKLGKNSLVQFGPYNDRVYLMKLAPEDAPSIVDRLDRLCREQGFSKVFAKVPASLRKPFDDAHYRQEALIPGFYNGNDDGVFLGRYLADERRHDRRGSEVARIIALAQDKATRQRRPQPNRTVRAEPTAPADIGEMSKLYQQVFPTYPFPIHDPDYLEQTMRSHVRYFAVRRSGSIIALSSAEMDEASDAVEMTDFATLPEQRGNSLASVLLRRMEEAMRERGMITSYTIARALSPGMNITFARSGYRFAGTLTNNTNISGSIQSMNVWHKTLPGGRS
jgi:putative beta-lysine N-acetyltransferase